MLAKSLLLYAADSSGRLESYAGDQIRVLVLPMMLSGCRSRGSKNLLRALRRISKDFDAITTPTKAVAGSQEDKVVCPYLLVSYMPLAVLELT